MSKVKICILQVKICILQVKICILQVEICIFQVTRLSKFAPPPGSFISSAKHFFGVLLCKKVFVDLCQHLIEVNSSKNPILWGKNPEFLTTPPPLSRLQVKICILQVEICILQVEIFILQVTRLRNFAPPLGRL